MRLLDVYTLRLTTFMGADQDVPPYAILSHTWGKSEVTFEDMRTHVPSHVRHSPRFDKIKQSCARASLDGLDYIWIDTCCIDKRSSAELSEAINSMFRWYQQSSVCYVYLDDFELSSLPLDHGHVGFCASRWFDRGWTLQELIAPRNVVFFDREWVQFGTRDHHLAHPICHRTGILPRVFTSRHCMCSSKTLSPLRNGKCEACNAKDNLSDILRSLNASVIMSWAANRSTTRREDVAYSLMGLFDVSMPLLYGEGERAFMRLQAAILARCNDHSILLWRARPDRDGGGLRPGCLALRPKAFEFAPPIVPQREYYDFDNEMMPRLAVGLCDNIEPMDVSETLLTVTLWLCSCRVGHPIDGIGEESWRENDWTLGILNCNGASDYFTRPAILLAHMGGDLYRRVACDAIFLVNPRRRPSTPVTTTLSIYHRQPNTPDASSNWTVVDDVSVEQGMRKKIKLLVRPSGPSLLSSRLTTYDRASSSSDAVCCVVNQPQRCGNSVTTRMVGGYPTMYSHDSLPPTVPMLRSLIPYACSRGLGLVGGIHCFEVGVPTMSLVAGIYVVWGLYDDDTRVHHGVEQEPAEKPWCRLFDSESFARDSGVPMREQEEDGSRYQKQLYAWLVKKSRDADWHVADERGVRKRVLPDVTRDRRAAADRILDLFPGSKTNMGLSARMNVVQGLGVTSNDVELTFFTPECRGWQGDVFDGSLRDQEVARVKQKPSISIRLWSRWPARLSRAWISGRRLSAVKHIM